MNEQIDTLLSEQRRFPPPPSLRRPRGGHRCTLRRGPRLEEASGRSRLARWSGSRPGARCSTGSRPHARWFVDGKLNASANCLDRHLAGPRRNKAAIVWEGEPGDRRVLTYWDLAREVRRCANALKPLGIRRGDRVAIYLPMIPEAVIAMLACARIGAVHSVVFGGFSAESLRDRINDAQAVALITADGGYRRGQVLPLKRFADDALARLPLDQALHRGAPGGRRGRCRRCKKGRDHWWHRLLAASVTADCEPEAMDAEDLLFILYTSGTTGKPQGHRPHHRRLPHPRRRHHASTSSTCGKRTSSGAPPTSAGSPATPTSCTARWPTAPRCVMYEGAPDWPERDRFWSIVETLRRHRPLHRAHRHPRLHEVGPGASRHGTTSPPCGCWAPSASRSTPRPGSGTTSTSAAGRCPIVDTWWQTETGGIMITPLPGVTTTKPGSATVPFPGVSAELVDASGKRARAGRRIPDADASPGPACSAPSTATTQRYQETYWSRFPGRYFAGDGAKLDEDGYWWILGRVDDVLNVAGHRIGTMEVESALVDHPAVAEAAVVGRTHELKGQALAAFVTLKEGQQADLRAQGRSQGSRGQEDRRASPGRTTSSSPPTCPRPGAARSCAGCSRTLPRDAPWATRRRWPIPPW